MALSTQIQAGAGVMLRDGSRVLIRPIRATDEEPLLAFLQGLSLDSRYLRFFSLCPDLARMAHSSVPSREGGCFGVVAVPFGQVDVLGHAGYWLTVRPRAEMAIAVADHCRSVGLGSLLLAALARRAHREGLEVFEMEVLPENYAALRLLMRSGFPLHARMLHGVVICELIIAAREAVSPLTGEIGSRGRAP